MYSSVEATTAKRSDPFDLLTNCTLEDDFTATMIFGLKYCLCTGRLPKLTYNLNIVVTLAREVVATIVWIYTSLLFIQHYYILYFMVNCLLTIVLFFPLRRCVIFLWNLVNIILWHTIRQIIATNTSFFFFIVRYTKEK